MAVVHSTRPETVESRLDSRNQWRIGGPGELPSWPLTTGPPESPPSPQLEKVFICGRATKGAILRDVDSTLLIYVGFERQSELLSLLDDLVNVFQDLGFQGRIEMIDPRAVKGPKSFPPKFTSTQTSRWEDVLNNTIKSLDDLGVNWLQVAPANRGYWEEVSVPTVLIKAEISEQQNTFIKQLGRQLEDEDLALEIMTTDDTWGLFAGLAAAPFDDNVRRSLGWPFTRQYLDMGMSIGRSFHNSESSTLGGYLNVREQGQDHLVGLTCYHGIRKDDQGAADPNIDSEGALRLSWPCQSPAPHDIDIFVEPLISDIQHPISTGHPALVNAQQARKQEANRKLGEIQNFNPFIGNVFAVSGWRNQPFRRGLNHPYAFTDWACIEVDQCIGIPAFNNIHDIRPQLLERVPEALPYWNATKPTVDRIAAFPQGEVTLFKQGRTTGLTAGRLMGILPAAHRINGLPGHLHHRGFAVYPTPPREYFAMKGDSGSWCLNGDGDLVGLLVGGDEKDGSGVVIPFSVILKDIENIPGVGAGNVSLP
ncbi:hypothetical protein V8E54_013398 [Elaphomyces granulatus]